MARGSIDFWLGRRKSKRENKEVEEAERRKEQGEEVVVVTENY